LWDTYLEVIHQRERKLLDFLITPKTMAEIVDEWIVYQRPREPTDFYAFGEQMIMQKHLDLLASNSAVAKDGNRYYRLE
ncbi:MAG: MBL fold metallo-hydrolase, partial [Deltaproteobacteria bacterium]|nr:MBL fold metallo-hydrolase [Deltaproteobacteria bacterium]